MSSPQRAHSTSPVATSGASCLRWAGARRRSRVQTLSFFSPFGYAMTGKRSPLHSAPPLIRCEGWGAVMAVFPAPDGGRCRAARPSSTWHPRLSRKRQLRSRSGRSLVSSQGGWRPPAADADALTQSDGFFRERALLLTRQALAARAIAAPIWRKLLRRRMIATSVLLGSRCGSRHCARSRGLHRPVPGAVVGPTQRSKLLGRAHADPRTYSPLGRPPGHLGLGGSSVRSRGPEGFVRVSSASPGSAGSPAPPRPRGRKAASLRGLRLCRRWGSNPHVPKDTGF